MRKNRKAIKSISLSGVFVCLALSLTIPLQNAYAQQIIIDGNTNTTLKVNGTTTNVSTATIKGKNAFNSFKRFNVNKGNTVNLMVPNNTNNLINVVSSEKSVIDGVLNSLHHNKIGGNIFFINPYGLVVSQSGSINVGSLTAVTPTKEYVDNFFTSPGNPNQESVEILFSGDVPINSTASIANYGKISALTNVKLDAGNFANAGQITTNIHFNDIVNDNNIENAENLKVVNSQIIITSANDAMISGEMQSGEILISADNNANLVNGNLKAFDTSINAGKNVQLINSTIESAEPVNTNNGLALALGINGKDGFTNASQLAHNKNSLVMYDSNEVNINAGNMVIMNRSGIEADNVNINSATEFKAYNASSIDAKEWVNISSGNISSTFSDINAGFVNMHADSNILLSASDVVGETSAYLKAGNGLSLNMTNISSSNANMVSGNYFQANNGSIINADNLSIDADTIVANDSEMHTGVLNSYSRKFTNVNNSKIGAIYGNIISDGRVSISQGSLLWGGDNLYVDADIFAVYDSEVSTQKLNSKSGLYTCFNNSLIGAKELNMESDNYIMNYDKNQIWSEDLNMKAQNVFTLDSEIYSPDLNIETTNNAMFYDSRIGTARGNIKAGSSFISSKGNEIGAEEVLNIEAKNITTNISEINARNLNTRSSENTVLEKTKIWSENANYESAGDFTIEDGTELLADKTLSISANNIYTSASKILTDGLETESKYQTELINTEIGAKYAYLKARGNFDALDGSYLWAGKSININGDNALIKDSKVSSDKLNVTSRLKTEFSNSLIGSKDVNIKSLNNFRTSENNQIWADKINIDAGNVAISYSEMYAPDINVKSENNIAFTGSRAGADRANYTAGKTFSATNNSDIAAKEMLNINADNIYIHHSTISGDEVNANADGRILLNNSYTWAKNANLESGQYIRTQNENVISASNSLNLNSDSILSYSSEMHTNELNADSENLTVLNDSKIAANTTNIESNGTVAATNNSVLEAGEDLNIAANVVTVSQAGISSNQLNIDSVSSTYLNSSAVNAADINLNSNQDIIVNSSDLNAMNDINLSSDGSVKVLGISDLDSGENINIEYGSTFTQDPGANIEADGEVSVTNKNL